MTGWLRSPTAHFFAFVSCCAASLPVIGFAVGFWFAKNADGLFGIVARLMTGAIHAVLCTLMLGKLWIDPNRLTDARWAIVPVGFGLYLVVIAASWVRSRQNKR